MVQPSCRYLHRLSHSNKRRGSTVSKDINQQSKIANQVTPKQGNLYVGISSSISIVNKDSKARVFLSTVNHSLRIRCLFVWRAMMKHQGQDPFPSSSRIETPKQSKADGISASNATIQKPQKEEEKKKPNS